MHFLVEATCSQLRICIHLECVCVCVSEWQERNKTKSTHTHAYIHIFRHIIHSCRNLHRVIHIQLIRLTDSMQSHSYSLDSQVPPSNLHFNVGPFNSEVKERREKNELLHRCHTVRRPTTTLTSRPSVRSNGTARDWIPISDQRTYAWNTKKQTTCNLNKISLYAWISSLRSHTHIHIVYGLVHATQHKKEEEEELTPRKRKKQKDLHKKKKEKKKKTNE